MSPDAGRNHKEHAMTCNITSINILNADDCRFSVLTDWEDLPGQNWPDDSEVKTALEALLGHTVSGITFIDAGDDLDEGIYEWEA
jgi:hypothetical protein